MGFELVRSKGTALPATVERQLTRIEHEALAAAQRVQAVVFVHNVAAVAVAGMVRTNAAVSGGDPAIEMALAEVTNLSIGVINSVQAHLAMRLR